MALMDTLPHNRTTWQRLEDALLSATGGDRELTAKLLPELHSFVVAERRNSRGTSD